MLLVSSLKDVAIQLTPDELKEITKGALSRYYTSMSKIYCKRRVETYVADHHIPSTDGKAIYMPTVHPVVKDANLNHVDACRAQFDSFAHECYHIILGHDEKKNKEFLDRVGANTWAAHVLNTICDARVNFVRARDYPGMRITEAWKYGLFNKIYRKELKKCKDLQERLSEGILSIAETGTVKGIEDASDEEKRFFDKARVIIDHARRAKTWDMLVLYAQYLILEGEKLGIKPPPQMEVNMGGYTVILTQSPNMKGNGMMITNLPDSVKKKIEQALQQQSQNNDGEDSTKSWHGVNPDESLDASELDKRMAKHIRDAVRDYALDHDKQEIINAVSMKTQKRHKTRDLNIGPVIAELDNLLRRIKYKVGRKSAKKGRRINVRKWIRFKCGSSNQDFYYKDTPQQPGNRAICVLIDMSGSMYDIIDDAARAAYAVSYVAECLDDKVCVLGYQHLLASYITSNDVVKIKTWSETVKKSDFESVYAGGTTPTPMGLKTAMHFLDIAPKPKKLLIVIEDGEPNVPLLDSTGNPYPGLSGDPFVQSQQLIRVIRSRNIKVLGIMLGRSPTDHSVRNRMELLYGRNNYIIIPSVRYLPKELFAFYKREMGLTI